MRSLNSIRLQTIALLLTLLLAGPLARAGTVVQFRTTLGNFDVELFDKDKPVTVGNFLRYITNGYYGDMFMHRAVTNFVIQGGGFTVAGRGTTNWAVYAIPTYAPITNEFLVGKSYSNIYGTIAMAKTSDPNSATSQFFINLANNAASLDNPSNSGGFAVFGRVIGGTNILNRFNPGRTNAYMRVVNAGSPFQELPVLKTATNLLWDVDLLYADITLLSVQVTATGNQRQISWNSINSLTNYVEYTAAIPPVWQPLVTTNGDGSRYTVTDTVPAGNGFRYTASASLTDP